MVSDLLFGTPPTEGDTFSGAFRITSGNDFEGFEAIEQARKLMCHIQGTGLPHEQVTIYDVKVTKTSNRINLQMTDETWWITSTRNLDSFSQETMELAAGFGGISLGTSFLGAKSRLSLDFNSVACSHLRGLGIGPVLHMDLTHPSTPKKVHQHCQTSHPTGLFGFPCQPFSSQGHQCGTQDPRFQVFWSGLRLMYLTQCQAIVLECVQGAGSNETVQSALHALAEVMDFVVLQANLDLADHWVSRRARWWAILLPKEWQGPGLRDWQHDPSFQQVGDIVKHWGIWSEPEERELHLTLEEYCKYGSPQYGTDVRLLTMGQKAGTLLHSYGNALSRCPCGCRSSSFAEHSLLSRGLRGFFVTSRTSGAPRYLHHREAALILGVQNDVNFTLDCKTNLCLLGLIASPLQAIWTYASLLENFALTHPGTARIRPEIALQNYKFDLLRQTRDLFWTEDTTPPGHLTLVAEDGSQCVVASPTATTSAQLLQAQGFALEWGSVIRLMEEPDNHIERTIVLGTGPYRMTSSTKRQRRDPPNDLLLVTIFHEDTHWDDLIPAGSFIFQVLRQHGIEEVNHLADEFGLIYGADYRVWSSTRLWTIHAGSFPTLRMPSIVGGRGNDIDEILPIEHLGLHDGTIWSCLQYLVEDLPTAQIPYLIHPRIAQTLLSLPKEWVPSKPDMLEFEAQSIFCIFAHGEHWAFLHGEVCGPLINWKYIDGIPHKIKSAAFLLATRIAQICDFEMVGFQHSSIYQQAHPHTCGTIAIAHAMKEIGLPGDFTQDQILRTHDWLLSHQKPHHDPIVAFGPGFQEPVELLAELLIEKGVPASKAKDRAQTAMSKIGTKETIQALQQRNPWAAIKGLASRPQTMFRLVAPEELTKYVDSKAKYKFGADVKQAKGKKTNTHHHSAEPIKIDPDYLTLHTGHFRDAEGEGVPQIAFSEVEVEAVGIALCTPSQAEHFIASNQTISSGALALLLVQEPSKEIMQACKLEAVTFPAKYQGTEEHIILFGALKQLGTKKVTRHASSSSEKLQVIQNQVIKVQVYRDELAFPWLDFIQAPVRHLLNLMPVLQLCPGTNCGHGCGKTHAAVDEPLDGIVLEVWSRSYFFLEKGKAPPQQAELFSVYLRVPKSTVAGILNAQCMGVYIEPKADSPSLKDNTYQVIWLPNKDRQAADHACRSCAQAKGLVRLKNKFGIRVLTADEAAAFAQVRPDTVFISASVQRVFQVFPLPHGTTRASIIAFLKEIGWRAKPLQPGRAQAGAMSWNIGTSDDPPSEVLSGFGRDVLVSEVRTKQNAKAPQQVIASTRTQTHMRGITKGQTSDPWQMDVTKDPWYKASSPPAPAGASGKSHLSEVTEQIRNELKTSIRKEFESLSSSSQDASMIDTSAVQVYQTQNDDRMRKLEVTVTEVQAQNQQFQGWFQQLGNRQTALESSVSQVQSTLETHHHEFQKISTDVTNMNVTLRGEVRQAMIDSQGDMEKRFDRLEALMAKKMKGTE